MYMPVDSALIVAAASRAVQSLLVATVAMERWSHGHRAFSVDRFCKNNDSAIQTQREFRKHHSTESNGKVPMRQTILNWVSQFRSTASALSENPARPRSVRNPENVERMRVALHQSPRRSARRHSVALRMSDGSVRRMLHVDLHFRPIKIQMMQELLPRHLNMRRHFFTKLLEIMEKHYGNSFQT
jgi:hypothetical protein